MSCISDLKFDNSMFYIGGCNSIFGNWFLQDKFTGFEESHQPEGTIAALSVVEIDAKYANLAKYLSISSSCILP